MIQEAGLTPEYIQEHGEAGLDEHLDGLIDQEEQLMEQEQEAKDLAKEYRENPDSPETRQKIEELSQTRMGRFTHGLALAQNEEDSFDFNDSVSAAKSVDPSGGVSDQTIVFEFNDAVAGKPLESTNKMAVTEPAQSPDAFTFS